MKAFYQSPAVLTTAASTAVVDVHGYSAHPGEERPYRSRARVAVYDAAAAAPRVVEIEPAEPETFIEAIAATVHGLASEQGGAIPYTVIREVSENLIHAGFAEPVISILDRGATVRFADQGPGIPDKAKAQLPGFTTATAHMKRYIRGVGSGLPIVKDFLSVSGGSIELDDNLGSGAVVTISSTRPDHAQATPVTSRAQWDAPARQETTTGTSLFSSAGHEPPVAPPQLTTRQKQVLALVMESGSVGPSFVSRELNVGISTAYRDLASLEDEGLISADGGKRRLTDFGMQYLDGMNSRFL